MNLVWTYLEFLIICCSLCHCCAIVVPFLFHRHAITCISISGQASKGVADKTWKISTTSKDRLSSRMHNTAIHQEVVLSSSATSLHRIAVISQIIYDKTSSHCHILGVLHTSTIYCSSYRRSPATAQETRSTCGHRHRRRCNHHWHSDDLSENINIQTVSKCNKPWNIQEEGVHRWW